MIGLRERLVVRRHDALDRRLQVLERCLDLRAVRRACLLHRRGKQVDRVVALGRRDRRIHAVVLRVEGLEVADDERLALRRGRFLDEGLRHACAFTAGARVVDVVGHRQGPRTDDRHLPAELGHAVGDLRELGADAVGQHDLGAGFLGLEQLGRHVDVLDVELFDGHRLDAFLCQRLLQILATELAVVGRIGKDGDLLEVAARDRLLDDHRRLDRVVRGVAEDVVLRLVIELVGDDRAGRHVVHDRNLRFLEEALGGERDTGVDVADDGDDLFLVHELLGDLHATLVLGLVVALDHLQRSAEHAAGLVDFLHREANAVAHADAHRGRAAGEGTVDADLDRVGSGGEAGAYAEGDGGSEAGQSKHEMSLQSDGWVPRAKHANLASGEHSLYR